MTPAIIIGSRGSDLALWQANHVASELRTRLGCEVHIKIIKTVGDRVQNLSFDKMEGKGFFTKEIEEALIGEEIDLAVHSLKDLMTTQPEGLALGAVGYRDDRRELLLIRLESFAEGSVLPVREGGVIGTSSARRQAQIASLNPRLTMTDLRGNVPTRVRKLRDGQYDAIVIAKAGVDRLDLELAGLRQIPLAPDVFLPAPAQGVLGLQVRKGDTRLFELVSVLNSRQVQWEVKLERGLLARFDAGCSLPLGVCSRVEGEALRLRAVLGTRKGSGWDGLRRVDVSGTDADRIVDKAFEQLTTSRMACA